MPRIRHPRLALAAATLCLGSAGVATATAVTSPSPEKELFKGKRVTKVVMRDGDGDRVGTVLLASRGGLTTLTASVRGLTPGFHGFHVHAVGKCEGPDFKSAGGHVKSGDQAHGGHTGDLPVLLVRRSGNATSAVVTDAFDVDELRDADGSAIMIHAKPDNYANVPTRYAPAPDKETLDTGDAGDRVACGTIGR